MIPDTFLCGFLTGGLFVIALITWLNMPAKQGE